MRVKSLLYIFLVALPVFAVSFAQAADNEPIILGKGTNLAHWISQTKRIGDERNDFLQEKDFAHIKSLGFDHVRLPIDEVQMWDESGVRDAGGFKIMHNAVRWALKNDLKVLVDLHILRSHYFNAADKPLWYDPAEQEKFIDLWRDLSKDLKQYPTDMLAYELMNEPVADDHDDWNKLVAKSFAAVRDLEPGRTIVIGSNRWQSVDTFDELEVPDDPNIILSFHFYEPFVLSHYQTRWTFLKNYKGPVRYPGVAITQAEFDAMSKADQDAVRHYKARDYNKASLTEMMAKPLALAKKTGLPLYCGEYGIFDAAPEADRLRWYKDVLEIFEENNISSANWNYKSDQFGMVGNDGKPFEKMIEVLR